jgi:hypothetical protein
MPKINRGGWKTCSRVTSTALRAGARFDGKAIDRGVEKESQPRFARETKLGTLRPFGKSRQACHSPLLRLGSVGRFSVTPASRFLTPEAESPRCCAKKFPVPIYTLRRALGMDVRLNPMPKEKVFRT